jgi:O-acetyl-ADP-ribose deacetylase (regulator of RNase III)
MADRSADYRINRTVLGVTYANITKMNVEALVSSDDTELAMAGGVSLAILLATGERLMEEVRKHAPLRVGEVAVTSAGDHSAKYVFHAAMIDYAKMVFPDDAIVARATGRCLELADALHLRTIAFPALGTGVGQFPFQRAAEAMTRTLTEYLSKGSDIDHVSLCLFGRRGQATDDKDLFYERAIGLAAIAEQGRSLRSVLVGLQNAVVATGRPDLVQEMGDLARRLQQADDVLQQSADTTESLSALEARSGIGPISEGLVALSTDVEEQSGH